MKNLSIYRGLSRNGIGEGPGQPRVSHGEQYLAADPPLDEDGGLLSAARPWMTLDWRTGDEQVLGERIEAWSCFSHGGLRLVARLIAAGIYDRRAAYFAHGRAFSAGEFAGACDPGACLGRSEAFAPQWRDDLPSSSPLSYPSALARPEQIQDELPVAGSLLAHLHHGLIAGYPVVVAVPVREFAAGGPLHALVSFARAALPLELKLNCRIRIFTRLPELFLCHLQADLIVVPEDEAGNALTARRDATLLDRQGVRRVGRELAPEAAGYAEAVLQRFKKLPGGLLAFSGAIGEFLPKGQLPGETEIARISPLYNLLALRSDPAMLGEWVKTSLVRQVAERPTGLAWDRLIRPEDWHALAFEDLVEILSADASGEEAGTLARLAEAEARRPERTEVVTAERLESLWNARPEDRRPATLAKLLGGAGTGRSLVTAATAARLSSRLPLRQILDTGCAGPLLAAELEAGALSQRSAEVGDLAKAASQDLRVAATLSRATSAGALSADWAVRLLETAGEEAAVATAAEILPAAVASLAWRPLLPEIYDRLLRFATLPPALAAPLAEALRSCDPQDPLGGFHDFLVLTELLVRTGTAAERSIAGPAWETAARLSEPEEQREFLQRLADPVWRSLQPERLISDQGRLTLAWAEKFADLLLATNSLRDVLTTGEIARLAGDRPEIGLWLDPRMETDPQGTTTELLRSGQWPLWRSRSALGSESLRRAALAWLASEVWKDRSAPQALLEDWKQVVEDLGARIAGEELRDLLPASPPGPRWPCITPFEDVQFGDLCCLAALDPGALAELADGLHPERDLKYALAGTIFEHVLEKANPPYRKALPADALAYLSTRAVPPEPLPPQQAGLFFEHTEHRRDRAAAALRRSVERFLPGDPLASLRAAEKLAPWSDHPQLVDVIERWRERQPSGSLQGEVLDILRRNLLFASVERPAPWNPAAFDPTVQALLRRSADDGCWKRLGQEVFEYVKAGGRKSHPVSRLAEQLRKACPRIPQPARQAFEGKGWETFSAVLKSHSALLREPLQSEAPLPALEVVALLLPGLGIGGAALRLLFHDAARGFAGQPNWWESLLAGVGSCCRPGGPRRRLQREEMALNLIVQLLPDLPRSERETARPVLEARIEHLHDRQGLRLPKIQASHREMLQGAA